MNTNPYIREKWKDHIVDTESEEVIQEGTRFTATRMNNIEEGIHGSYEQLAKYQDEITKLRIQLEMIGRVPVNNGTFFDTLEEGNAKALTLLKNTSAVQHATIIGANEITVEDSTLFKVGEEVTILDEENKEGKVITNILGNAITVSALVSAYKKGALVVKSNVLLENNKLAYGSWGNYDIKIKEVI